MQRRFLVPPLLALCLLTSGCQEGAPSAPSAGVGSRETPATTASTGAPSPSPSGKAARQLPEGVSSPPAWLGTRVLSKDEDGFGIASRTPPGLRDRRFVTRDLLPPPARRGFVATSGPVPPDVLRRSTWHQACPVSKEDLAYLTVTFWGFDERRHTGEMIVHESVAEDVRSVFRDIYRARWPIEEMRVTARRELRAPPTGDGNNTGSFVCRDARLSDEWSEHAYGLAIDVNPFHNPYIRGDLVLPELAIAYSDRSWHRRGMLRAGDPVTSAFQKIGWGWGGDWTSSKDWMHFARSGT